MRLFEPGKIGKLTVKNRVVMAAMGNRLLEPDGRLSQRGIDFYVARAKGGAGLIMTYNARTRQIEQLPFSPLTYALMIDSRIYVSRLNELAEAVHDYGAKLGLQVTPGQGRNVPAEILRSAGAVAPSPLPAFADPRIMARELTSEEIEKLAQAFQVMAEIARVAGVDAIEINAHGGYLCDEFLTSLWNKRTDRYGGDLGGRLRFILEIIRKIKKGAGADFPVIVKYGLTHYLAGGREIQEGLEIARRLEAAGVDALEIDAGCYETIYWLIPPTTQPPGCMVDLAERVKQVVNIPVITVGRLHYPDLAERVLQEGKADFIGLGRALLADPEWPNKVKEGRLEDICPCVGDNEGCRRRTHEGKFISCTVNPACGMEKELTIIPTEKKKVAIMVGGGPANMEAARVLAIKGHRVTLYEKKGFLGGNLVPGSSPEFKEDYRKLLQYLSVQLKKLGVDVRLGTELTLDQIRALNPDVVFIATGSLPIIPKIPGVDGDKVMTAIDLLSGRREAVEPVVIIGGGTTGCETALALSRKTEKVTIVEMLDTVMSDSYSVNRAHLLKLLDEANVQILTGVTVTEITDQGVVLAETRGQRRLLEAESVVLATGSKPEDKFFEALNGKVPELYAIGDCVAPRKLVNAIGEGFRMARLV